MVVPNNMDASERLHKHLEEEGADRCRSRFPPG